MIDVVLGILGSIVAVLLLICLIIFVHELGHFVLFKIVGVRVLRFSIGFGREIFGKQIGETRYSICWIPLGGYVKPAGEEIEDGDSKPDEFFGVAWYKRLSAVLAGSVMNYLFGAVIFILLILVWNMPIESKKPVIGAVVSDMPAQKAGLVKNDLIVSINSMKIDTWYQIMDINYENAGKEINVKYERNGVISETRVLLNLDQYCVIGIRPLMPPMEEVVGPIIGEAIYNMPARRAGLKRNDKIISIDSKRTDSWIQMAKIIHGSGGREIKIEYLREDKISEIMITPEVKKGEKIDIFGALPKLETNVGFFDSVCGGFRRANFIITMTIDHLVGSYKRREKPQVAGPIGIIHIVLQTSKQGVDVFLGLVAMMSISIGWFNLLPIMPLDGGHAVVCILEGITRRKVNKKLIYAGNVVGIALLLMVLVFATYNDILRLIQAIVSKFG